MERIDTRARVMDTQYLGICKKYIKEAYAHHAYDKSLPITNEVRDLTYRLLKDQVAHFVSNEDVVEITNREDGQNSYATGKVYVIKPENLEKMVNAIIYKAKRE